MVELRRIADAHGLKIIEDAAAGIISLLEQTLLHAVEYISIERGYAPRRFTLVAAGGERLVPDEWLRDDPQMPILRTLFNVEDTLARRFVRLDAVVDPAVGFFIVAPIGTRGWPTPIIESRVTSSASCSSPRCSVPAGRIGSTM